MKNRFLFLFSILAGILISIQIVKFFAYTNSQIICAKFIFQSPESRGGYSMCYTFKKDGENIIGLIPNSWLKNDYTVDSLKKINCIKIEVSNYSTFFNRIVDKRVLK